MHNRRPGRGRQHHLALDACLSSGLGSGNDIINIPIIIIIITIIIISNIHIKSLDSREHHLVMSSGLGTGNDIIIIIDVIIIVILIMLANILENGSRYNDPRGTRQQQLRHGSSLQAAIPPHQASTWR